MKHLILFLMLSLLLGCNNTSSGFETPEGPITPDGYRPPPPTKENLKTMIREAIKNMVFINGGSYMMGNFVCYSGDLDKLVEKYQIPLIFCRTNEGPLHKVTLDSFYLNKYEISYYEYDLFTQAAKRPLIQFDILNPQWWGQSSSYESAKRRFSKLRTGKMPAAIDWFQANDYCRWIGDVAGLPIELPTEAEWEYAARNRGQDFNEGEARFQEGARCAIHLSEPIDINKLKIDLSKPAPDSRAEWLPTKDGRTSTSN